ncbi:hypothetical protein ABK814_18410 [Enterobacter hormaechei]|uniref:hypothetical protein n=1 Tax=Enterobacteriaceae TaxID=543 RepID=UPI000794D0E6|nr:MULTISPECIES: hypothetical protein [Enterobacteriaceae]MDE4745128.1 hypothetical protein [Klebsiella pneumoniae]SAI45457.1 Uncharacterised protein [Enterobacter hormaechei]
MMKKAQAKHELENLLSKIENPRKTLDELETAQWHYMDLVGITSSGIFDSSTLDQERNENPHLLKVNDGLPVFDDDQCAEFMSTKHNLSLQLCMAYVWGHKW